MILGKRADWELFQRKNASRPDRVDKARSQMQWLTPDIWHIPGPADGEFERRFVEEIKRTGVLPDIKWQSISGTTAAEVSKEMGGARRRARVVTRRVAGPQGAVPHKKPPSMWGKVASYWRATRGPRVKDRVRDSRLSRCLAKAGYTWAPVAGVVTEISTEVSAGSTAVSLTIGGNRICLPSDELPAVQVGDTVQAGQTIADGVVAKPCPLLKTKIKDGKTDYFCGACGCGVRNKAELTKKLKFNEITCPRTPPQFVPEPEGSDGLEA